MRHILDMQSENVIADELIVDVQVVLDLWEHLEMCREGQMSWLSRQLDDANYIIIVCSKGLKYVCVLMSSSTCIVLCTTVLYFMVCIVFSPVDTAWRRKVGVGRRQSVVEATAAAALQSVDRVATSSLWASP